MSRKNKSQNTIVLFIFLCEIKEHGNEGKINCSCPSADSHGNPPHCSFKMFSAETLKAIAILMNTNYKANPDSFKANDFLYEENASGSIKDVYGEIKKAAESAKNKTLRKNSEALFVPYSETSNGTTYKNKNYKYIHSVASPWDCYQTDFDANAECVGVSLSGIDYLCKNGCSAEEALLWYLPNFEIADD